MSKVKDVLTSLVFFTILAAWTCLLVPIGWLIALAHTLTGRPVFRSLARAASWFYGHTTLLMLRPILKVRSINAREAANLGPCIITANHQSALDLYLLSFQSRRQICPVTKAWPFRLLLPLAPVMRTAGYIEAENRDPEDILRECRARLAEGCALVFFPEGRRSRDGALGSFHAGAFLLALEENIPLVPMVIRNSFRILAPESALVRPGTVEVEMLPAIRPQDYAPFRAAPLPHRALLRHVRHLYLHSLSSSCNCSCNCSRT